jgi:hypothetical protein
MRLVVFASPPASRLMHSTMHYQREPRLKTAARLAESCSKLSAVRDKQVHQRVIYLKARLTENSCEDLPLNALSLTKQLEQILTSALGQNFP